MKKSDLKIAFFGTPVFAVHVLDALSSARFSPALIVTQPDRPQGRKQEMVSPPAKQWAQERHIEVIQPEHLKRGSEALEVLLNSEWDMFIVAAYGLIIPKELIEKPAYKTLNVHPSLLPKYRGPSPVQGQILADDRQCGITIMLIDEKVDHGAILAQARIEIEAEDWPLHADELNQILWQEGGNLLAETIPQWIEGAITPEEQDHENATFTKRLSKEDGLLDLEHGDPYQNYLKYCAFGSWPGTFFFTEKNGKQIRVKITKAEYSDGTFSPVNVIPEGKKETSYQAFLQSS